MLLSRVQYWYMVDHRSSPRQKETKETFDQGLFCEHASFQPSEQVPVRLLSMDVPLPFWFNYYRKYRD